MSEVNAFETGLQSAGVPHQITIHDGRSHAFVTSIEAIQQGGAKEHVTTSRTTLRYAFPKS